MPVKNQKPRSNEEIAEAAQSILWRIKRPQCKCDACELKRGVLACVHDALMWVRGGKPAKFTKMIEKLKAEHFESTRDHCSVVE